MYHKTGRMSSGEAMDDLNEQTNAMFAQIRRPSTEAIRRFDANLDVYRESHRHLTGMCDASDDVGLAKRSKVLQMGEDLTALSTVHMATYGATWAHMQIPSDFSKVAMCGFNSNSSASGRLFVGDSSSAKLEAYVKGSSHGHHITKRLHQAFAPNVNT